MRTVRLAALAALALACARDAVVHAPPTVVATGDLELPAREAVLLGASAHGDRPIASYSWTLVSAPAGEGTSLAAKNDLGDVAELRTASRPGLYVVAVTATDEEGLVSEPDFVNVRLVPPRSELRIALTCESGCRSDAGAGFVVDEGVQAVFIAEVLSGSPTGFRWQSKLTRDPLDPMSGSLPSIGILGRRFQFAAPAVARDASLSLAVTASAPGLADAADAATVRIRNAVDEPPQIALEWSIPGAKGAPGLTVLPGDALYLEAKVADPNGDPVGCEFLPVEGVAAHLAPSSDPCRLTVYPLAAGAMTVRARATTSAPDAAVDALPLTLEVQGLRLESAGPALTAVALAEGGKAVGTTDSRDYFVYDLAAGLAGTRVTATHANRAAAVSNDATALLGSGGSNVFGAWSFDQDKALPDLDWGARPNPPGATKAMVAGSAGRIWMAMDQGLALYDPTLAPEVLHHWAGGGLTPSTIAWGPSPKSPGLDGLVWYSEANAVYCQTGENLAGWAGGKGNLVGTVQRPAITALSFGTAGAWDLWVGTGPTGASMSGAGLLLYRDAVDPLSAAPRMNAPEEFFAQESGIRSVTVERGGPYDGDAWAVAGGKLVRVSRAAVEPGGERGAVALTLETAFDGKAKAVAVTGRRVAVATEVGMATAP